LKAVLLYEHGDPEVLQIGEFPTPTLKFGEVLVRVRAAALNRMDVWTRRGWPGIKLEYPHILGADGAGTIAAVGEGVSGLKIGERVVINSNLGCGKCEFCLAGEDNLCKDWHLLGETVRGTCAEYVAVPSRNVLPIPNDFDFHLAAAAALVFHTAWHSLIRRGMLRPAESVLVVGAAGGVNTASIQIAKYSGATVYVVGSNAKKLAVAEALGADYMVDRSQEENWSKAVYNLTGKRGVDVVVDNVGTTFPMSLRTLRKGGRLLTVGNTGGAKFEIDNRYIFSKHLSILGSTMGNLRDFATVMKLVFEGKLRAVIDRTYPLEEVKKAHQRLEDGKQTGKITLAIGE
jgi:NADPH:quinone reductase-like Zn-dependent oxidoreductase